MSDFIRRAGRIVVMTTSGSVLLISGHDAKNPSHKWWFSIGGGVEKGENTSQTCLRELYEETGICLKSTDIAGLLYKRNGKFEFADKLVRQIEDVYLAVVDTETEILKENLSDTEKQVIDDIAWWKTDQLQQQANKSLVIYPRQLPQIISETAQIIAQIQVSCSKTLKAKDIVQILKTKLHPLYIDEFALETQVD